MGAHSSKPHRGPVEPVEFLRTKYGPEILIDVDWVGKMPTFLRGSRPHVLGFYDILLVTRGRGWFWLDEARHAVRPGTVLFTSPGEVRRWRVDDLEGLCLFFPALFLEEFFHDPMFLQRLPYFHVPEGARALVLADRPTARLRSALAGMRRELRGLRPDSVHLLRARLYETLITLGRLYGESHAPALRTPHPVALRYDRLVEREVARWHRVADYSRELGVSPGHLNALCRRHLGRSAKQIIQDRLVARSRRLLLYSDESAARVGYALGFQDPSYFARFFRGATGRSPSAFRAAALRQEGR
jgi:AraC family transcriptional regulator, transcriptional activator of pobA